MTDKILFEPYVLGSLTLSNRIVMAPLTRNRAGVGLVPSEFAATYYSQRATAGLVITEATQISADAQGYQDTPGIYTPEQIAGWRQVTDAVHAKGGKIFLQIWHVGRISHESMRPNGAAPVAPSPIRAEAKTFVNNGFADVSEPRALDVSELATIDAVGSHTLANVLAQTQSRGVVAAFGLAQGADLPGSVLPFILCNVTLAGIDSVNAPQAVRLQAWSRLASDLDLHKLASTVQVVGLAEVPDVAARVLEGKVRGRTVVDVSA